MDVNGNEEYAGQFNKGNASGGKTNCNIKQEAASSDDEGENQSEAKVKGLTEAEAVVEYLKTTLYRDGENQPEGTNKLLKALDAVVEFFKAVVDRYGENQLKDIVDLINEVEALLEYIETVMDRNADENELKANVNIKKEAEIVSLKAAIDRDGTLVSHELDVSHNKSSSIIKHKNTNLDARTVGQISEASFKCIECGSTFRESRQLNRHRIIHSGARRFICYICGKAFELKGDLNQHMKNHDVVCTTCDRVFSNRRSLKHHMFTHTNERPFRCKFCDYRANHPSSLRKHEKNRHQQHQRK